MANILGAQIVKPVALAALVGSAMSFVAAQPIPAPGVTPGAPAASTGGASIKVPPLSERTSAEGGNFTVRAFSFAGNTVFSDADLAGLVQESLNRPLTFAELEGVTTRISRYYRARGYLVATAYLPPQTSHDGSVRINIVEGRYGDVRVQNLSKLNNERARALLLGGLCGRGDCTGTVVEQDPVERAVLLLKDLPGVTASATLSAGQREGTSDLEVTLTPTPAFTASVDADNFGGKFTGRNRLGVNAAWNNPSGRGDQISHP